MNIFRLTAITTALVMTLPASAQSGMTKNHDEVVMNQFMKAEIGSGTLGAGYFWAEQVYYGLTHKEYRNMANNPANNKLASRTLTYAEVLKQEGYATQIKDSLIKRAEIELLNMTDRLIDVEWLAEEPKLKNQLNVFKKNIQDIGYYGGSSEDKTAWTMIYNLVGESIDAAHEAYMPNSQRKSVYLLLYKDICTYNTALNQCKAKWWAARQVRQKENKTSKFMRKNRAMINDCYGRWKLSWSGKKGNSGGVPGSGAIGIDAGK